MNHAQAVDTNFPMRYVLGELAEPDRDAFEAHLADCSRCMEDVWSATQFAANAREVFRDGGTRERAPVRRLSWLRWPSVPAFAFSAALNVVLAACLGYGAFRLYPGLRAKADQALAPATIEVVPVNAPVRAAAAQPPVVHASGNWIVLSFDLPQAAPYTWSVAAASGAVVLSGDAAAHEAGVINLMLPTGRLAPGQYKVTADAISGEQREELGSCLLEVGLK